MPVPEYEIIQNEGLAAVLLWAFANEYDRTTQQPHSCVLPLLLPVLPICFHAVSVEQISTRNFRGGLFRAVSESSEVAAGLQYRMERMVSQTLNAVFVAVAAGLLHYDAEGGVVRPARRTLPAELDTSTYSDLVATSRRLGRWFAELPTEQVCIALQVRF